MHVLSIPIETQCQPWRPHGSPLAKLYEPFEYSFTGTLLGLGTYTLIYLLNKQVATQGTSMQQKDVQLGMSRR